MNTVDLFFFSSRRRHTRSKRDWSSDVCSSISQTTAPDICQMQCWYDNVVKVDPNGGAHEIGRASCRERVYIQVGAGTLKKKELPERRVGCVTGQIPEQSRLSFASTERENTCTR